MQRASKLKCEVGEGSAAFAVLVRGVPCDVDASSRVVCSAKQVRMLLARWVLLCPALGLVRGAAAAVPAVPAASGFQAPRRRTFPPGDHFELAQAPHQRG